MILTESDHAQFLAAILAAPDDDAPRLVYADFLDDTGEHDRAEFIRVQCELAQTDVSIECKTPEDCYYSNRCKKDCGCETRDSICEPLRRRERELLEQHGERWAMEELVRPCGWKLGHHEDGTLRLGDNCVVDEPDDFALDDVVRLHWHWSRGFIGRVELTHDNFLASAKAIFTNCPVTRVVLMDKRVRHSQYEDRQVFIWFHDDDVSRGGVNPFDSAVVSAPLFDLMRAAGNHTPAGEHWNLNFNRYSDLWYDSESAALDALSSACVRHGRRLAWLDATPSL